MKAQVPRSAPREASDRPGRSFGLRSRRAWVIAVVVSAVAVVVVARGVDGRALGDALTSAARSPLRTAAVVAAFGAAFVLRAVAWRRVLPGISFGQALAGIHVTLGANHVLPFRMGEPFRVLSVVRRAGIPFDSATASTLTLRAADLLALVIVGWLAAPSVVARLAGPWAPVLLSLLAVACAVGLVWIRRLAVQRRGEVRLPDAGALGLTVAAWLLESAVVWQSAQWAGLDLGLEGALAVTAASVVAQMAAVAPGGVGTYEGGAVAAYAALGHAVGPALAAALTAHALKTVYALIAGFVSAVYPAPSLIGRFRLDRPRGRHHDGRPPPAGPVVLFLPAHDEEASVGDVVARVPDTVEGRDVQVLVIDDGSTDATAAVARAAGAQVVSMGTNQGLGAAVRRGFEEAVARDAAAVVFCDADGEYAPEEIGRLVSPVLAGDADYVVGSRFSGDIRRMLPHRRLGNLLLTRLLALVARHPITDGQSGYRALSRDAVTSAEIVHDFNYAQVLTLDLLDKGFRYGEVPISYAFRSHGRSFVRLGPYLRRVAPAVYRELNPRPAGDLATQIS